MILISDDSIASHPGNENAPEFGNRSASRSILLDSGLRCRVPLLGLFSAVFLAGCKSPGTTTPQMTGDKPGEERCFEIAQGLDIDFRWVPPGEFVMGSPPNEPGRSEEEIQKLVRIKNGFWIAEHETTVLTWLKVMEIKTSGTVNLQELAAKPVVHVSWYDCQQFLKRLKSPAPGWKYALPSESQWEYACRAGSEAAYAIAPTDLGWIAANSDGHLHAVEMKQANAWGLHDMHGNVAEWCRDWVGPNRSEVAIRGGSWESDFSSRAAARNSDTPFLRINRVGFRLVLDRVESVSEMPDASAFDIAESHTR